jgi:uncharacterized protein
MQENPIPPTGVRWKRLALTSVGCLSLATGVVGAFVPVLPTTCFLLLAAGCFSRSSPRLNSWMKANRWFGRYLAEYRESGRINVRVKFGSLIVLWASLFISAGILGWNPWVTAFLFCTGLGVSLHVGSIGRFKVDRPVKSQSNGWVAFKPR